MSDPNFHPPAGDKYFNLRYYLISIISLHVLDYMSHNPESGQPFPEDDDEANLAELDQVLQATD